MRIAADRIMEDCATLGEVLARRAEMHPDRRAYTVLADGESDERVLTYGDLFARARAVAARLIAERADRQPVLIVLPTGLEYLVVFYGCLLARAMAVPVTPPRRARTPERLLAVAADCRPALAIAPAVALDAMREACAQTPAATMRWVAVEEFAADSAPDACLPPVGAADIAFLQYTSGSIAAPKGVIVTHRNLMANQRMIRDAFGHDETSTVVGWLPLYHDMGLIGNVMQPLFCGAGCVLMAPEAFLMRPLRWVRAISRYRGATSGAPNFAYDLCASRARPEQCEGLDLSCWRLAYNGSEPVRAETMERFARRFEPHGFSRAAARPCYGLAEATLLATCAPPRAEPSALRLDAVALQDHRVLHAADPQTPARWVPSCGPPWRDARVRIADPETGIDCPPDRVGEVLVAGGHVTPGYWQRPDQTAETFRPDSAGERWLHTGDLGFLHEGELHVTGRIKDLVILGGRNHYPGDLELTAAQASASIRPGGCCAFSIDGTTGEELVLLVELERAALRDEDRRALLGAIQQALGEAHDVRAADIAVLRPGSILRTSSGKIRRHACRQLYLAGGYRQDALPS
ncbi:MAG: fatty acyl-AMP ligase [Candidatus Sumerlaeia bacterium]|nr:fatty acyl-AMP ligase [Candidatus Sumerlaeia bacterium]